MLRGAHVRLEADRALQIYGDGEHVGPLPATFEVLAGALQVVMP
jgi:diacylglycerol kinase family enzyme